MTLEFSFHETLGLQRWQSAWLLLHKMWKNPEQYFVLKEFVASMKLSDKH